MTTGQLRRPLRQIREILSHARRVIDVLGGQPHPAHWHEALAGVRNAASAADALGLAVEEGGVATTHEAITALDPTRIGCGSIHDLLGPHAR